MKHRIKELIKEKGYTQQEFADKLGISRVGFIQLLEKPSFPTLEKIAEALEVPMWQLFASTDEVRPKGTSIICPNCGKEIKIKVE